jgi:pyruvate-formate lyase-activating enzyme
VTGRESWNPAAGKPFDALLLAERVREALHTGARTVQILGGEPTIHLPAVLELVALLPEEAHLVWKTNGHASAEARSLLDGIFNTWVIDFKFGNDDCAERLAGVRGYLATLCANLRWAFPRTNLIVRHLLMPGHLECCWKPVAAWLARQMPGVKVSLRTGFWPAWRSRLHTELLSGAPDRLQSALTPALSHRMGEGARRAGEGNGMFDPRGSSISAGLSKDEAASAFRVAADYGLNLVTSGVDLSGCGRQDEPVSLAEGEILLLPDGRVLSHNTTPALAGLMHSLGRIGKEP